MKLATPDEARGRVGGELGIDRSDEPSEEFICRLRVRHGEDNSIAGLLAQSAPMHQQRRVADRPLAEKGRVLRMPLARPADPGLEDGRLTLPPSQQRREDPAARSECVVECVCDNCFSNPVTKTRYG